MKPDYPKIIFVGVPLLLMLWGIVFILLVIAFPHNIIAGYAALVFIVLSIPGYGYLATRFALQLRAVVDDVAVPTPKKQDEPAPLNHILSRREVWFYGAQIALMLTALLVAQGMFHATNKQVLQFMGLALPVIVILEVVARKAFRKKGQQDKDSPNQAL